MLTASPLLGDGLEQPPQAWLQAAAEASLPVLESVDAHPALIEAWMASIRHGQDKYYRLGRHAEQLWAFWCALRGCGTLLTHQLPIVEDKRTLGEIDLIFEDPQRGIIHWEIAVKYYLRQHDREDALDGCRGPHPADHLGAKLARLRDHQIPLGHHPTVTATIGHTVAHHEALLRGWLFHPADSEWQQPTRLPASVHPQHPRGWWLRYGTQECPISARSSRFIIAPRRAWIAPFLHPDDGTVQPLAHNELRGALLNHFRSSYDPLLIFEIRRDELGWWAEIARGFVVHGHWPELVNEGGLRESSSARHSAARSRRP